MAEVRPLTLPWTRSASVIRLSGSELPCLRRSLVAGHLLRRHDPSLRLGVGGAGDALFAHAWIEIDDHADLARAAGEIVQRVG